MKIDILKIISQAYDLHVHIGPEIIPRKFTVRSLIKEEDGKIAGMVLKNHFFCTVPFVREVQSPTLNLIGSIVLNNFVGGLNPEAVYAASTLTRDSFIVWFPTTSAKEFLDKSKWEIAPEWVQKSEFKARVSSSVKGITVIDRRGKLTSNAIRILRVIKQKDSVLATGHISWRESLALVKAANAYGIKRIIITHPIYQKIDMPLSIQHQLVKYGAKIEHCYSMWAIDRIPMSKIANQIKTVGAENCIVSSDVGQAFSTSPSQALHTFCKELLLYKISIRELEMMLVKNPRQLVGFN